MHLVALVERVDHVCCRYRLAAFRPILQQSGHTLELLPLEKTWWRRLLQFRRLSGATVVLQRRLLSWWQLQVLRRCVHRLIYDFDDAVYLRDSYAAGGQRHVRRLRRFAATVRAADVVVAGNSFLAAEAQRYTVPGRVVVIPTCVDVDLYAPRPPGPEDGSLEMVWVGSSSTLQGLERARPLLDGLGGALPGLRLKLVCDRFLAFEHLHVVTCPWREATEARDLASADVGIALVPDDQWSRGKCGLKVLQYMAAGLPVIANRVGVHPEMIQEGRTGYLADTPGEWLAALRKLSRDGNLRRRLGQEGRRLVEGGYSVGVGAAQWARLLDQLEVRTPGRFAA